MLPITVLFILLLSVFVIFGSFLGYVCIARRRYKHIPTPRLDSLILGHLPSIFKRIREEKPFTEPFLKWYAECGPVFAFYVISNPIVVCLNSNDFKVLYENKCLTKSSLVNKLLATVIGQRYYEKGIGFEVNEETWFNNRKHFDPIFKKKELAALLPIVNDKVDNLIERLSSHADDQTATSIKQQIVTLTQSVLSQLSFGKDLSYLSWTAKELGMKYSKKETWKAVELTEFVDNGHLLALNPLFPYLHPWVSEQHREAARAVRKIAYECIEGRLNGLRIGDTFPQDILAYILRLAEDNPGISHEDLIDHMLTFLVAGTDTVAWLLSFAFIFLNNNPSCRDKLTEEIDHVMGERTDVTNDDLPKFEYIDKVLKETLRYYPPAAAVIRVCTKDVTVGGYRVPAGTHLIFPTFTTCHMEENFKNPETFDPERFSLNSEKPNAFTYLPFGFGAHYCIGKNLALMEAKVALVKMFKNFTFSPASNKAQFSEECQCNPLLNPRSDILAYISRRRS